MFDETDLEDLVTFGESKLLKETKAILSLLFRSYWATEEEKLEFEFKK